MPVFLAILLHFRRLLPLVLAGALLQACTVPQPQVVCHQDSECESGKCLGGLCVIPTDANADSVDVADVANGDGGKSEIAADGDRDDGAAETAETADAAGDVSSCTSDKMCDGALGILAPCTHVRCLGGSCIAVELSDASTCTTAGICPALGSCASGICVASGKPCDDGEPCTNDECALPDGCTHTSKPDGVGGCDGNSPCTVGICTSGVCNPGVVMPQHCFIDGACRVSGDSSASQPCARCLPEQATSSWSVATSGACDDNSACTSDETCDLAGNCTGTMVFCGDGNPCTTDNCTAQTGCVHLANADTSCTDGNPCSTTDTCKDGACIPLVWNTCEDGNVCTSDLCDKTGSCVHAPLEGACIFDGDPCTEDKCVGGSCAAIPVTSVCIIDGNCHPAGSSADGEPCLVCDPGKTASAWTPVDGSDCNDSNACTGGDLCYTGACIGAVSACDDKNPCTKDSCTPISGCVFVATTAACDDGNACTSLDDCSTGNCVGMAMASTGCDDGNPCTDDSCIAVAGCIHTPNQASCDDGIACTSKDFCTAGVCHGGKVICACGAADACDDGNPCTVDGCDPTSNCINQPVANFACNDGNACTASDHCAKGYCIGAVIACNDGEACTADGCTPEKGCVIEILPSQACSDGNACTLSDGCVNGSCVGTPKNCDDGKACTTDLCSSSTGKCEHVTLADGSTCTADGSACTIDACAAGVCSHSQIVSGLCQIDGVCMDGGTIQPGEPCVGCLPAVSQTTWSIRAGLPCSDGNSCTGGDTCTAFKACVGSAVICSDGNPCTVDVCNPLANTSGGASPCLYAPTAVACDDGDPCTISDTCVLGNCVGKAVLCDDGNACTLDACVPFQGCAATAASGQFPCASDDLSCTSDVCMGGYCKHPTNSDMCLISGICRVSGQGNPGDACSSCNPASSTSAWSPTSGNTCDDGNPCTLVDSCTTGSCSGSGIATCDDGNACTSDACSPTLGCVHNGISGNKCEDGNLCTTGDTCVLGVCTSDTPTICPGPDASSCQIAACDSGKGCIFLSRCNGLEGCYDGACTTLDAAGLPAPVTVPLDPNVAPQPLAPTLRWQLPTPTSDSLLPHLLMAVQTRGCAPQLGLYSAISTVTLPANQQPVLTQIVPTSTPQGSSGWCAVNPQILRAVNQLEGLPLTWLEGGNALSPCDMASKGGAIRLALVGPNTNGNQLTAGPLADCPGTGVLAARPAVWLQALPGSTIADVTGVIARASKTGVQLWLGQAKAGWGGAGTLLTPSALPGWTASATNARPLLLTDTGTLDVVSLSLHDQSGKEPLPTLDLTVIPVDFSNFPPAEAKFTGVDNTSTQIVYRGAEVAWDPDTSTLGVLISGTLQNNSGNLGFLAVARTTEDGSLTTPTVLRFFAPPPGTTAPPVLHAFRIAEIPNSPDFLLAFGALDSNNLELLRIHGLSDTQFNVQTSRTVATDFVSHETGDIVLNSGGLSEIAISPDGLTASIVYETVGAVRLVSLALP